MLIIFCVVVKGVDVQIFTSIVEGVWEFAPSALQGSGGHFAPPLLVRWCVISEGVGDH